MYMGAAPSESDVSAKSLHLGMLEQVLGRLVFIRLNRIFISDHSSIRINVDPRKQVRLQLK